MVKAYFSSRGCEISLAFRWELEENKSEISCQDMRSGDNSLKPNHRRPRVTPEFLHKHCEWQRTTSINYYIPLSAVCIEKGSPFTPSQSEPLMCVGTWQCINAVT